MTWLQSQFSDLVALIARYGPACLILLMLWLGSYVLPKYQRDQRKDFSWWSCWIIFTASSATVLGLFVFNQTYHPAGGRGGEIERVPSKMDVFSERDTFYIAKHPSPADPQNLTNYNWLTLENPSDSRGLDIEFLIRRNIQKPSRDPSTLQIVGSEIDPAPVEFVVHIAPDQFSALNLRKMNFTYVSRNEGVPKLESSLDHSEVLGHILSINSAQNIRPDESLFAGSLINSAFAKEKAPSYEGSFDTRLSSASAIVRAESEKELWDNFEQREIWVRQKLEDANTNIYVRAAIASVLRNKFSDVFLHYPEPRELSFLSVPSYIRIILDGLDNTSSFGINNRRFINEARDERIRDAFGLVYSGIFQSSGSNDRSCLMLFEFTAAYNWAAITADDLRKSGTPLRQTDIAMVDMLIGKADSIGTGLIGRDAGERIRTEYLRGAFYGRLAIDKSITLWRGADRNRFLQISRDYFTKFVSTPESVRRGYQYPFQFPAAAEFLARPSIDSLELKGINAIAIPDRSCKDPAQAGE